MERRHFLAGLAPLAGAAMPAAASGRALGAGRSPYGERSPFERAERLVRQTPVPGTAASRTPLQETVGIITPSSLHFERHHSGVPAIDPARHDLLLHGLVAQPLVLTMTELKRLPAVSRIHFIECAGNSGAEHAGKPGRTAQESHGLASCSEWTGVLLSTLLREVGVQPAARWVVAEGADASRHSRSIPMDKALDDVIVAYGQNGEALRPEQGYPLRLLVPGWEGSVSVKWLHALQLATQPAMSRDEAASYTDLMPDGRARRFSFEMDVKSVITRPSGAQRIDGPGTQEISGLAWSGRGKVARVEVSVDAGLTWTDARLDAPVLPKAFTRFSLPWRWDGRPTWLLSRATDDTGDRQPARDELVAVRGMRAGPDWFNHYNGVKGWRVNDDGAMTHA